MKSCTALSISSVVMPGLIMLPAKSSAWREICCFRAPSISLVRVVSCRVVSCRVVRVSCVCERAHNGGLAEDGNLGRRMNFDRHAAALELVLRLRLACAKEDRVEKALFFRTERRRDGLKVAINWWWWWCGVVGAYRSRHSRASGCGSARCAWATPRPAAVVR